MISHKYKCIFVHIPGTGGTYIEKKINGHDTWRDAPEEKYLSASQLKKKYEEYWDSYFKFSFVRNPIDRFISLSRKGGVIGLVTKTLGKDENGKEILDIFLGRYKQLYGSKITIETPYKEVIDECIKEDLIKYPEYLPKKWFVPESSDSFPTKKSLKNKKHKKNAVYLNFLDEEMDFIGKHENFVDDLKNVFSVLGVEKQVIGIDKYKDLYNISRPSVKDYVVNDKTRKEISSLQKEDIRVFYEGKIE